MQLKTLYPLRQLSLALAPCRITLILRITGLLLAGSLLLGSAPHAFAGALEDGQRAVLRGDYPSALQILKPLAEQGSAPAQFEIGHMYETGQGVPKDYARAAEWYLRSSRGDDHQAQMQLALLYARGQGVAQDDKQGLYWLRESEKHMTPQQQSGAVLLYMLNRGSFDKGRPLSMAEMQARALPGEQRRADQGDPHFKCILSHVYESGQAKPRESDDLIALKRACTEVGFGAGTYRGPPLLPIPPVPHPIPPANPHN